MLQCNALGVGCISIGGIVINGALIKFVYEIFHTRENLFGLLDANHGLYDHLLSTQPPPSHNHHTMDCTCQEEGNAVHA